MPSSLSAIAARGRHAASLLWTTLNKFFADGCPTNAAALTFYTFFSLPALLALLLALVGAVTDPQAVERVITTEISDLIGPAAADQVATIIAGARRSGGGTRLAAGLGIAALVFGATTAFAQLQAALNRAWRVKPDPQRGDIRNFLVKRIFSFGVVLTVAFLLLVSLVVSALLSAFGTLVTERIGAPAAALEVANALVSFGIVALLFAVMFKVLPDAVIAMRDVAAGAIGTALLFVAGKALIGYWLGRTDPGSAYGAAGSLAIILLWVYYSSLILLFGAEFTQQWAERYGRGVHPEKGAVSFVEQEFHEERG